MLGQTRQGLGVRVLGRVPAGLRCFARGPTVHLPTVCAAASRLNLGRNLEAEKVLQNIRYLQYGGPEHASDERAQYNRNERAKACRLLSTELYAKEVHFLLELIQNADDNSYAPGAVPKLHLQVSQEGLTVFNNETGFTETNVRAICTLGSSTKTKKAGFVGEKGIGFKSVFSVADQVSIYSNGFCFQFDSSRDLGYIEPEILDPAAFPVPLVSTSGTTMYLRFKPDLNKDKLFEEMQKQEPESLLFLNKLRCLHIELPDDSYMIQREPAPESNTEKLVCTRSDSTTTKHFLIVSQDVSVPESAQDSQRRADVTSTSITLAFPLSSTLDAPDLSSPAYSFAYLPISPSGLKFIVQADFIVTASRETILEDKPWNVHLRDELEVLLLDEALPILQRMLPSSYLAYMPLSREATKFFSPLASGIQDSLAECPCVLTGSQQWRLPRDTRYNVASWTQRDGTDLFSDTLLSQLADLHYVKYLQPCRPTRTPLQRRVEEVLKELGCSALDQDDVLQCLTSPDARGVLQQQPSVWFIQLYKALDSVPEVHKDFWGRLRSSAPIFRLEGSSVMQAATKPNDRIYMWDESLFDDSTKAMVKGRMHVLDPTTWDTTSESVLASKFDIRKVDLNVLIRIVLNIYKTDTSTVGQVLNRQHLIFIAKHYRQFNVFIRQNIDGARMLHCSEFEFHSARELFYPDVPDDVQPLLGDLLQSGVTLAHKSYAQSWAEESGVRALLVNQLRMKVLSPFSVAEHLVTQYKIQIKKSPLKQHATKRQLTYLLQHEQILNGTGALAAELAAHFRLPSLTGKSHLASELHLPLQEDLSFLQEGMHALGLLFVNSKALPDDFDPAAMQRLLKIKQADELAVVQKLLRWYQRNEPDSQKAEDVLRLLRLLYTHWEHIKSEDKIVAMALPLHVFLRITDYKSGRAQFARASRAYLPMTSGLPPCLIKVAERVDVQLVHPDNDLIAPEPPASAFSDSSLRKQRQVEDSRRFLIDRLEVKPLNQAVLLEHYLKMCKNNPRDVVNTFSDQDMLDLLRLVAEQCSGAEGVSQAFLFLAKYHALVRVVSPDGGDAETRRYATPCGSTPLYLPGQGDGWSLQDILGVKAKVLYVHDDWVGGSSSSSSSTADSSWTQFLQTQLGIQGSISPEKDSVTKQWHVPDELQALLNPQQQDSVAATSERLSRACAILCMLRDTWDSSTWAEAAESEARDLGLGSMLVPLRTEWNGVKHCRLDETFLHTDVLAKCFAGHVPYLDCDQPTASHWQFLSHLGVACQLTTDAVLRFLAQMSEQQKPLSPSQYQLYGQLGTQDVKQLKEAFGSQPLIYLPGQRSTPGQWTVNSSMLRWKAGTLESQLRLGGFTCLEAAYGSSDARRLFQDVLGIPDASTPDLGKVLINLSKSDDLPADKLLAAVSILYKKLAALAEPRFGTCPQWLKELMAQEVLLVGDGSFTSCHQAPVYLPDDPDLAQVFSGMDSVHLLAVDSRDCATLEPLFKLCPAPVHRLSMMVEQMPPSFSQAEPSTKLSKMMLAAFPYAAALAHAAAPGSVQAAIDSGRVAALGNLGNTTSSPGMCVYMAQGLTTSYQLDQHQTPPQAVSSTAHVQTGAQGQELVELYVDLTGCDAQSLEQDYDLVLDKLAMRYAEVWGAPEAASNISQVFDMLWQRRKRDKIVKRLQGKGIQQLPDELLWQLQQAGLATWGGLEPGTADALDAELELLAASMQESRRLFTATDDAFDPMDTAQGTAEDRAEDTDEDTDEETDEDADEDADEDTTEPASAQAAHPLAIASRQRSTIPPRTPTRAAPRSRSGSKPSSDSDDDEVDDEDVDKHRTVVMASRLPSVRAIKKLASMSASAEGGQSQAATQEKRERQKQQSADLALRTFSSSTPISPPETGPRSSLSGILGELYVWRFLSKALSADQFGWVSSARQTTGGTKPKQEPPYDFWVEDVDGGLFGQPNALVLVEVKSSSSTGSASFYMSNREWAVAMELSRRATTTRNAAKWVADLVRSADPHPNWSTKKTLVFVIVVVGGVTSSDVKLERVLVNPGQLYQNGVLSLSSTGSLIVNF